MTPVGMVGMGKLGLPVAYGMASRGLEMWCHDPFVTAPPTDCSHEAELADTIKAAGDRLRFAALTDVVANCSTLFVAVQTPHGPRFEGVTPLPDDRADFDYTFLVRAVQQIAIEADRQGRDITIAVISTVLPGTMAREVAPVLGSRVTLRYTPSFIAMGTTIRDFLDPEFVLIGGDTDGRLNAVYDEVYGRIDGPRRVNTTVENAELIKVAYNTFIGLKIAFANTVMEVCHKTGCDVDEVTGALKLARRRLISGAYMDGGMGDGGGCHPRDNIALSWLARELSLSYDLFEAAMVARERQAEWLCDLMEREAERYKLPLAILGFAYKPGSHITTGSPALLVKHMLDDRGHPVRLLDGHVIGRCGDLVLEHPHVYLIGCKHPEFQYQLEVPPGSVVIDPFRYIPDQPGSEVIRIGEGVDPAPHNGQAEDGGTLYQRAA